MSFIDIHTHKEKPLKEVTQVVIRDFSKGKKIINRFDSIGIHPWSISSSLPSDILDSFDLFLKNNSPWMLGEIGLDKAIETNLEIQIKMFKAQLRLAKKHDIKRIVIHSVRAYSEILAILKQENVTANILLHDFNSTIDMAKQYQRGLNTFFSFGKRLFQENTKAYKTFPYLPVEKIFLETDDSELAIQDIYKQAAHLRAIPETSLKNALCNNFKKF